MTIPKWGSLWDRNKRKIEPVAPLTTPPQVTNAMGRVWVIDGDRAWYAYQIGVFRVMWPNRVIVYAQRTADLDLIRAGVTVEVVYGRCGRPDVYNPAGVRFRFTDCQERRRWMRHPVCLSPRDVAPVDVYLELTCGIEELDSTVT